MTVHYITVSGCDDSTTVTMDVTEPEFEFLRRLAEQITAASSYGCQPRMSLDDPRVLEDASE